MAQGLSSGLQDILEEFRERYGFPGATAAFVLTDGSVVTAATGFADVEAGQKMTPASRMLAASIGKSFVGATIIAHEHEGLLSQEDRLAYHLGEHAWFAALQNAQSITLRHLLRHQSGLPDHPHMPAFQVAAAARIAAGQQAFGPTDLLEFMTEQDALFEAGTAWAYSDTGYILLGLVIEKVTGRL